jgi:tetratricopeptide (TPR) repeat protein
MGVARIDALTKQEQFSEARTALVGLTATARQHDLPAWGALLRLLESSLTLAAHGDLGRTLDLAFRALTTVEKLADPAHHSLQLCARLTVARCWLKMDEVGYAPDVARLIQTTLAEGDTGEWWFWYQASLAWAFGALNQQEEADSILARMLADFPGWMARPDQIEARAYVAYRMRRLPEGQRYAAVRCELNRALCLNEAGAYDRSMEVLQAIRPQTLHLANRHYPGLFYCLCGRNANAAGEYDHAAADLGEALNYYDGRGWLRDEARITIERLEALRHLGDHPDWRSLAGKARSRVARLRSTDLQARLEKVVDGWTSG